MKEEHSILVIEDEAPVRELLVKILKKRDYIVRDANSVAAAHRQLERRNFDLILMDLTLPDGTGLEILEKISEEYRNRVIIVSGHGTIDIAVEAMRKGAYDFLKKPVDHQVLLVTVKKALSVNRTLDDFRTLTDRSRIEKIIFKSKIMADVVQKARECALSNKTVLVSGETGTGKELIARAIHNESERKNNPFITVNCSTIPISLAESELFGFERGAFTGADKNYPGKFLLADKGTIFLDEIGELHAEIQPKLLRVLESGEIFPLKSNGPRILDIRVIAATNRNLKDVDESHFRRDLYYRIQQVEIVIPPIRKRKADIIPLVEHFIHINNITNSRKVDTIDKEAQEMLIDYHWPGNVRELKNVVEEIMGLVTGSVIRPEHLPSRLLKTRPGSAALEDIPALTLQDVEKEHIRKILTLTRFNIQKSAKVLGIGRPALYRKIEKYKIKKSN